MTDSTLWRLDAVQLAYLIRNGKVSSREVVASSLERAHSVNSLVNAATLILDESALQAAGAADAARAQGTQLGLLHGVPVTVKINVDQVGLPTDHGLVASKDQIATEDSPVVSNLRHAGAVIIARTNSPAFAMRGHTDNVLHGATINPWNRSATPGGSSGGAAVAAAVGIGTISHGNDIGGSIRWPAYCNGVIGLRPTPGRIPQINKTGPSGRAMCTQLMAVQGPLARSVRDVRVGFEVMARNDPRDNRYVPAPLRFALDHRPIKVALVTCSEGPKVQPAVWAAVHRAGEYLQAAGYCVEEVSPPDLHAVSELWHALGITELFHVLGPQVKQSGDAGLQQFIDAWFQLKPPRDLPGYLSAFAERDSLLHRWQMFFQDYPLVVMPSSTDRPVPAGIDALGLAGAQRMLDALYFQMTLPVLGIPGLAMPVGMDGNMPMGVQLVAGRFREDLLFDAGEVIEAHEGVRVPIDPV